MTSFPEKVYQATRRIPRGMVATYADIAAAIGNPRAVRAVGNALNRNPDTRWTPCHRVVRADGTVGGYAHGTAAKVRILRREGARFVTVRRVDLTRCRISWGKRNAARRRR